MGESRVGVSIARSIAVKSWDLISNSLGKMASVECRLRFSALDSYSVACEAFSEQVPLSNSIALRIMLL